MARYPRDKGAGSILSEWCDFVERVRCAAQEQVQVGFSLPPSMTWRPSNRPIANTAEIRGGGEVFAAKGSRAGESLSDRALSKSSPSHPEALPSPSTLTTSAILPAAWLVGGRWR